MRRSRPHRRRSRRRSLRRQQLRFLAGFGVVVIGLLVFALTSEHVERERHRALLADAAGSQPEGPHPDDPDRLPPPDPGRRSVFPYSIVDGGVRSPGELKEAIERDPVVAKHFAGFDLAKARLETLQEPKVVHMSYRIGDDVFWTRETVVIPAGETVLTDGTTLYRTRGANQLASTPGAVSPLEPPASLMDTPLPARPRIVPPTDLPAVSGPGAQAGSGSRSSSAGSTKNPPNPSTPGNPGSPRGNPGPPAGNLLTLPIDPLTPPVGPWRRPGGPFTMPYYPEPEYPYDPGQPPTGPNEPRSIPEPGTTLLMIAGGAFAAWRRWKTPERSGLRIQRGKMLRG